MQPTSITLAPSKQTIILTYPQGQTYTLTAHLLRVESPGAEVKGHFGQGGKRPEGKENVTITGLNPVGSYALQIVFSDGHQTGLYTWDYLYELATNPPAV